MEEDQPERHREENIKGAQGYAIATRGRRTGVTTPGTHVAGTQLPQDPKWHPELRYQGAS